MDSRPLAVIALVAGITLAAIVAVFAYRGPQVPTRTAGESGVVVEAPGVRVETDPATGKTSVRAPFTNVEKDASGTRVRAPGADIDADTSGAQAD